MSDLLKRYMKVMMIISILLSVVVVTVTYRRELGRIQDVYVDEARAVYFLEDRDGDVSLNKTDENNRILFSRKLPSSTADGLSIYYDSLTVDATGHIYLLALTEDANGLLKSEYIAVYDPVGKPVTTLYEIVYDDQQPVVRFQNRLNSLSQIDGTVQFFDFMKPRESPSLGMDVVTILPNFETSSRAVRFASPVLFAKALISHNKVYYVDQLSRLYEIDDSGRQRLIPLETEEQASVTVYIPSTDRAGNICYTDTHNITFAAYDPVTGQVSEIYGRRSLLASDTEVMFRDVQDARYIHGYFVAVSPAYAEKGRIYIVEDDTTRVISRVTNSVAWMVFAGVALFLVAWLAQAVLLLFIGWVARTRSLLVRLMAMLLPFVLAAMAVFAVMINNMMQEAIVRDTVSQVYLLSKNLVNLIDGDEFSQIEFPIEPTDPYIQKLNRSIDLSLTDLSYDQINFSGTSLYYAVYTVKDNRVYVAFGEGMQSYMNADYISEKSEYRDMLSAEGTGGYAINLARDVYGYWLYSTTYIRNAAGETVGFLELGIDYGIVSHTVQDMIYRCCALVVGFTAIIYAGIVLSTKNVLRNLKALKAGASELSGGNWFAKVDIRGNDEIRDVGNAFNLMSSRIEQFLDNMLRLNKAYEKFVPSRSFKLLGTENVLDINLNDQQTRSLTLMHLNFINFYQLINTMTREEKLAFINQIFQMIAQVIELKNGMIETFDGSQTKVVYESTAQAFESAFQILEEIRLFNSAAQIDVDMGISIQTGLIMVGVVGNDRRVAISTVSDEVSNAVFLADLNEQMHSKLLATSEALAELTDETRHTCRYIGRFEAYNGKMLDIFDMLDGYASDARDKKIRTKAVFEQGIRLYGDGAYADARKQFIDVMRMDIGDEIAKYYLFKCDERTRA